MVFTGSDEVIHLMELCKDKYGLLINDCEATTNWSVSDGSGSIVTAAVTLSPAASKESNFKELGSLVIRVTGTASAGGKFTIKYDPTGSWNINGVAASEYATSWLKYLSLWFKGTKAGNLRVLLTDTGAKTEYWDTTVVANTEGYIHLTLASPTSVDGGFDPTLVDSITIGYTGRTNGETSMDFRVDGIRVQGDPTFNSMFWTTGPQIERLQEPQVMFGLPKARTLRRAGAPPALGEEPEGVSLGPSPVTLIRRRLRIEYVFVSDKASGRSEGKIRYLRDYFIKEMRRIIEKNSRAKLAQGIDYFEDDIHVDDSRFETDPPICRGYMDVTAYVWRNVS